MPENFKKTLVGPVKRPNGKSMPKNVNITLSEVEMQCSDGLKLKGQMWECPAKGNGETHRILCLHGWLDNCRSYYYLAPELIISIVTEGDDDSDDFGSNCGGYDQDGVEVIALDLPGHGLSSHKSPDNAPLVLPEYTFYVAEALALAQWWQTTSYKVGVTGIVRTGIEDPNNRPFTLIGHSMGSAISTVYSAAFPEQVKKLVLLDSLGYVPSGTGASDIAREVRAHVSFRQEQCKILQEDHRFYYATYDDIFESRLLAPVNNFPGRQYISKEAVKELLSRGIEEIPQRGFRFKHDPRLAWTALQYFTQEQINALYKSIMCEVCVLLGQDGWPQRLANLRNLKAELKPTVFEVLPGSHSLHADPDSADRVVQEIRRFCLRG